MRFASLLAVVSLAAFALPALAQEDLLAAGDRAYEEGRIEEALAAYESATRAPIGTASLARAHLRGGVMRAITGDREGARSSFAIALALTPDAEAPSELDPSMQGVFREVARDSTPLRVRAEVAGEATRDAPTTVEIEVAHPLAPEASRFRLTALATSGDEWTATLAASGPTEVAIPTRAWRDGDRLEVTIEALTAHDGVLATETLAVHARVRAPVLAVAALEPEPAPPSREPSFVEGPWFWVVTIGLAVAAAITVGLVVGLGRDVYSVDRVDVR